MAAVRIVYSGDEAAAHAHLPAAQNLLHKTREQARTTGAGVTGLSLLLADGVYAYTLKVSGTEVIFIHADPVSAPLPTRKLRQLPDFLSGATRDARLEEEKAVIDGQDSVRTVLLHYKPTAETAEQYDLGRGWQASERLAVSVSESLVPGSGASQFKHVIPSNYSGRMRGLVQVLLGYGKLGTGEAATEDEENGRGTGEVIYDWRWQRTHTIHKAADGQLWLVEISITNGVIAMPLPTYEDSQWLKDSDRPSIAAAATEFDGLPTGEGFPTGRNLADALLSGDVLQLLSREGLAEFYRLQPFSVMHGWTTNTKGDEAYNIGWYFGTDGVRRSRLYSLDIRIGALAENRLPNQPLASGQAIVRRRESARYFHPSPRKPPPYKVYEPNLDAVISVEFLSSLGDDGSGEPDLDSGQGTLEYDAPMFCAFIGDQLSIARYNWNPNAKGKDVSSSDGPCRFNGTTQVLITTYSTAYPVFYSEQLNVRSQYVITTTRIVKAGKLAHLRYDESVDTSRNFYPQWYSQWRNHVFRVKTDTQVIHDASVRSALVTPEGLRDGYVLAKIQYIGTKNESTSTNYLELKDPYAYNTFSYFFDAFENAAKCWLQFDRKMAEYVATGPSGEAGYYDSNGNVVIYNLSRCRALVDRGDWLRPCQNAPGTFGPSTPRDTVGPATVDPGKTKVEAILVVKAGGESNISLKCDETDDEVWLIKSPDPDFNTTQQMSARFSAFGVGHRAYNETLNGALATFGPLIAGSGTHKYNFLGVL